MLRSPRRRGFAFLCQQFSLRTNEEGILLLEEIKEENIINNGVHLQTWNEFLPVLEEYAELLELKIEVSNPHATIQEPEARDKTLFIKFNTVKEH